jgi:predicted ferric reductase
MTSAFVPLKPAVAKRVRTTTVDDQRLARCAFTFIVLLEVAAQFFPDALLLNPMQATVRFKQFSGYAMFALMSFAMGFGCLRRLPAMANKQRLLNEIHQFGGLLILLLLAVHPAGTPRGFLLWVFHAMAVGLAAGALRAMLGTRFGRGTSTALLVLHIGLSCLVSAGVLLHLYFVYAYTA